MKVLMKKPLGFQPMNLDMLPRSFLNFIQNILQNPALFQAPNIHSHFLFFITHFFSNKFNTIYSIWLLFRSYSDCFLIHTSFPVQENFIEQTQKKRSIYNLLHSLSPSLSTSSSNPRPFSLSTSFSFPFSPSPLVWTPSFFLSPILSLHSCSSRLHCLSIPSVLSSIPYPPSSAYHILSKSFPPCLSSLSDLPPILQSPPLFEWGPATSPTPLRPWVWPFVWVFLPWLVSSSCFLWLRYTLPCACSTGSTLVLTFCCNKQPWQLYTAHMVVPSGSLSLWPHPIQFGY